LTQILASLGIVFAADGVTPELNPQVVNPITSVFAHEIIGEITGEVELAAGRLNEALLQSEKARTAYEESGRRPGQVSAMELQTRILLQLDRPNDVLAVAESALPLAYTINNLPMIWRLQAARAQALEMLGKTRRAVQAYKAAAEIIGRLADTIPDTVLKQNFLGSPVVARIVAVS
jgi:hypothetical protein